MKSCLKKGVAGLFFGINVLLTLFGFFSLYNSPYTGIRLTLCGQAACVNSVDAGSPSAGIFAAGDVLVKIDDVIPPSLGFTPDPDYIRSRKDIESFWSARQMLSDAGPQGSSLKILVQREDQAVEISLAPVRFPFWRALMRTALVYLVAWTFMVVAYLVLRRKENEIAIVNFLVGSLVCMNFVVLAPFTVRDLYFSFHAFRTLVTINTISYFGFSFVVLHLMLVFPHRKKILLDRPWLAILPYVGFVVTTLLHTTRTFDNTYVTTYMVTNACLLLFFGRMLYDYFKESNVLYKRQIQWVVFGTVAGVAAWLGLTALPVMMGMSFVSEEISVLPTIIYPLCFAFAVMKYRLMDIETIFDHAVVYGFTIIVLEGIELVFLSVASPVIVTAGLGLPSVSLLAVLLIVLIYLPVRNKVRYMVEKLFRRGSYDMEKEIQKLTMSLGLCDSVPALEKFVSFVNELLRPSGILVVFFSPDKQPFVLYADGEHTRRVSERFMSLPLKPLWSHIAGVGSALYGYELGEKALLNSSVPDMELENAVFVTFLPDGTQRERGYLAVLLKKQYNIGYSRKDLVLLDTISLNIASIIAAGELRRERDGLEERFRKEKEYVMKELHDGLGNILTSITVASQAAQRVFTENPEKAIGMVQRMNDFSTEAMDFLRTGLMMLDNPDREIGDIIENVRTRFTELFSTYGLELSVETADGASGFKPGAAAAIDLTRCIQEALTNVIKHADARNVRISLSRTGESFDMIVADDGKGFEADIKTKGFGIRNIANRMQKLHGTMKIVSSPGKGTMIKLSVPAIQAGV